MWYVISVMLYLKLWGTNWLSVHSCSLICLLTHSLLTFYLCIWTFIDIQPVTRLYHECSCFFLLLSIHSFFRYSVIHPRLIHSFVDLFVFFQSCIQSFAFSLDHRVRSVEQENSIKVPNCLADAYRESSYFANVMKDVEPILDRFYARVPGTTESDVNQIGYATSFFVQVRIP